MESLISAHQGQLLVADYGASVTLQVAWESAFLGPYRTVN